MPKPVAFTQISSQDLSFEDMRLVVRDGKSDTAMMAFSKLLSEQDITAVVTFVRQTFFEKKGNFQKNKNTGGLQNTGYHTIENGWANHEQYQSAYPFVLGEIALDEDVNNLTVIQRKGKKLYFSACISCHDRVNVKNDGVIWQSYPLSWPRNSYSNKSHNKHDAVSQATQYHIHDIKIVYEPETKRERHGQKIFQMNCAFCHAADGSGKHWIGQFINPPARDFTQQSIKKIFNKQLLKERIENGVEGSSMPAWRYVLSENDIDALVSFMWRRFE